MPPGDNSRRLASAPRLTLHRETPSRPSSPTIAFPRTTRRTEPGRGEWVRLCGVAATCPGLRLRFACKSHFLTGDEASMVSLPCEVGPAGVRVGLAASPPMNPGCPIVASVSSAMSSGVTSSSCSGLRARPTCSLISSSTFSASDRMLTRRACTVPDHLPASPRPLADTRPHTLHQGRGAATASPRNE